MNGRCVPFVAFRVVGACASLGHIYLYNRGLSGVWVASARLLREMDTACT